MVRLIIFILGVTLSLQTFGFADPTRPLLRTTKPAESKPKNPERKQPLTAIFSKGKNRYAVIEEKIYRAGDTYRNAKIIRITDDNVILRTAQGTRRLTLIQKIKK